MCKRVLAAYKVCVGTRHLAADIWPLKCLLLIAYCRLLCLHSAQAVSQLLSPHCTLLCPDLENLSRFDPCIEALTKTIHMTINICYTLCNAAFMSSSLPGCVCVRLHTRVAGLQLRKQPQPNLCLSKSGQGSKVLSPSVWFRLKLLSGELFIYLKRG